MTDPALMLAWLDGRISSTRTWLETHGPGTRHPWPAHDIEAKQLNLERYEEIRAAYARALAKREAAE